MGLFVAAADLPADVGASQLRQAWERELGTEVEWVVRECEPLLRPAPSLLAGRVDRVIAVGKPRGVDNIELGDDMVAIYVAIGPESAFLADRLMYAVAQLGGRPRRPVEHPGPLTLVQWRRRRRQRLFGSG